MVSVEKNGVASESQQRLKITSQTMSPRHRLKTCRRTQINQINILTSQHNTVHSSYWLFMLQCIMGVLYCESVVHLMGCCCESEVKHKLDIFSGVHVLLWFGIFLN